MKEQLFVAPAMYLATCNQYAVRFPYGLGAYSALKKRTGKYHWSLQRETPIMILSSTADTLRTASVLQHQDKIKPHA